jgi:transcriptional regulator with XRE-family HTH domain
MIDFNYDSDPRTIELRLKRLGKTFSEVRWRSRLSCHELSGLSDIAVETIYQLEAGELDIDILTLSKLLTALQVLPEHFFQLNESNAGIISELPKTS